MGCTGSKRNKGGIRELSDDDIGPPPDAKDEKGNREYREKLKGLIEAAAKDIGEKKMTRKLLEQEKCGIALTIEKIRTDLVVQMSESDRLREERAELMHEIWTRDADDIYKACRTFGGSDKDTLINILTARTRWQIRLIANIFNDKYKADMDKTLESSFKTLLAGKKDKLCRLVLLRAMEPEVRDAKLLREYSGGISLDDDGLIEILMTRSNKELRDAFAQYKVEFDKDCVEIVTSKISVTEPNYKQFMGVVLQLKRNEQYTPYESGVAVQLAQQLYEAGAARSLTVDYEPFIRILGNANHVQFDSINAQYKNQALVKDIKAKLGGSLRDAVEARCTEKYTFLSRRLFKDSDSLPRILGCLTHQQCRTLRETYDAMDFGTSLQDKMKAELKGVFQKACLNLVSGDQTLNPLGSNNELAEDEKQAAEEGLRSKHLVSVRYNQQSMISAGEFELEKLRQTPETETPSAGTGLFGDLTVSNTKLFNILKDYDATTADIIRQCHAIQDEIESNKNSYFELTRLNSESSELVRIYSATIESIKNHLSTRS